MSKGTYHISLYRRYRPQRLADVVGQEEVIRTLRNALIAGDVAHAYLFAGERGIGKTSVARILARAVNCLDPRDGEPCNTCAHCKTILENRSLDILEIDGASNRGIDHIRRLREEVAFAPTDLERKVYIIDEVHMLTNEAFNALLKTLEEPPSHAIFLFATTEPHKVPRTIVSRCQAFDFRKIPEEQIAERLSAIAMKEGVAISQGALGLISRRANGGMRDAIVMLEQAMSYAGQEISLETVLEMMGLVGRDVHERFLEAFETGDRRAVLETVDGLVEHGKDLETFLADLVDVVRDRLVDGEGPVQEAIALCRGLLEIKQDLFRSLDRRILFEVGLLSLMERVAPQPQPASRPAREPARPRAEERALLVPAEEEGKQDGQPAHEAPGPAEPVREASSAPQAGEGGFLAQWAGMLQAIEGERIAIAAFLAEAAPHVDADRVIVAFHPEHTFHKESLEKPANLQYLAGMIHRHLGDRFSVDVVLDDGVERKPSSRQKLHEKARLVCQLFDGTIVKEE